MKRESSRIKRDWNRLIVQMLSVVGTGLELVRCGADTQQNYSASRT